MTEPPAACCGPARLTAGRSLEDSPTPLVLLHSLGLDAASFGPLLDRLGRTRHCIALDLPGHGRSRLRGPFRVEDAASAVGTVLDELNRPVDLMGVSLGGVVAQVVAAGAAGRVRKLVLANTFARLHTGGERLRNHRDTLDHVVDRAAWARGRAHAVLNPQAPEESRSAYIRAAAAMDPATFLDAAEAVYAVDLRDNARLLRQPTLVVAGELDERTPLSALSELAELIPAAELVVVPGAGHLAHLDRPDRVAAEIVWFLDGTSR